MSTIREHRSSIGAHIRRQTASPSVAAKKVSFQLPSNLKGTLLDFTSGQDHRPYQDLVCILRDSDVKDADLCLLLRDAQDCISLLDQNLRLFIQVLLVVKWAHRGPEAVSAFQSFLLDLCSAHNYHTKAVLDHLTNIFKSSSSDETCWTSGFPPPEDQRIYKNVHHVLKKLLKVIPMANELLVPSLISAFPYVKRPTREIQAFSHNVLEILKYQPNVRQEVLHLIANKLVQLDVNAPRGEIEAAEEDFDDSMDVDAQDVFPTEEQQNMKHPLASTLDYLMLRLFKYIESECTDPETGVNSLERSISTYKDFQQVFEKVILPTHNTHHVQFLMWYICSLRPKLGEVFINNLWRMVTGVHVAPVTRQSAAAYVSSFLARADFFKIEYLKSVLQEMSEWIHSYINNQDGQKTVDMRMHSVFYSVCQALFYLLCFRHKDLFKTRQNMVFLRGLNLTKMVTCSLNPLRVCIPEVVKKFASITRAYQLVYCNSVIERNARSCMPIVHNKNHVMQQCDQPNNWLDTFFPFDPYKLRRSSSFINPTYVSYQGDDIHEDNNLKADDDEDDFLPEPMSVNEKKFTYSASPGFLQDHFPSSSLSPRLRHNL